MIVELGLGLTVGTIMALTGAGGGILAVPLLVFVLQIDVVQAGPIGLLAVGLAAMLGAANGLKVGIVRYRAALLMSVTGMIVSPFGVWLAHRLDNHWLSIMFSIILFFIAYRTYHQAMYHSTDSEGIKTLKLACVRDVISGQFLWTTRCARSLAISGGVAGLFSGLLGVGGGFVIVPALQRYTDLVIKSVVATSLTVIAIISLTGVILNASVNALNWLIAIPFCAGALAGIIAGRLISSWLAGPQLHLSFAVLTLVVAVGMMLKAFA